MSGGGSRVSIPNNMKKTIQNIKEITGNHSEEEIYAMLKECSMDPNETAQKLLYQDPFHEVKRKRDRRKENVNTREPVEPRWRPGSQGRGSRGARGNFSSRYTSHDGGGKNSGPGRDSGTSQVPDKGVGPSLPTSNDTKDKETTPAASLEAVMANGPSVVARSTSVVHASNVPAGTGVNQPEVSSSTVSINKLGSAPSPVEAAKSPSIAFGTGPIRGQPAPSSSSSSSSAVCFSSSDPVLVPSNDLRHPSAVGTIKREVGSHRIPSEQNIPAESKLNAAASEVGGSFMQGKMPSKSQGLMKNQLTESSQPSSVSTHSASSVSRPPSSYSNRSQETIGSLKGSNKEWKPKSTNPNTAQGSGSAVTSEVSTVPVEASARSQTVSSVLDSEEATSKLQKKLGELHLPQRQHVIIPNHIHVPESERTKLSFGSFNASFGVTSSIFGAPESEKSPSPVSESSQVIEETVEESAASNQITLATAEVGAYPDHPQSPAHVPENFSGEGDVAASTVPEYNETKQDNPLLSGGPQYSMVHTSPNYNFGFVPPMLGSQFAPFENSDSQARDVSRLPSFLVQQPFDPASYYAQFYRSGADGDGRVSPFPSQGVAATKYNGNVAVLPPQTSQSPQEGGNSLVLSTAGQTPLVTQAAASMQSSMAMTQQPVPVFRPPAGMHISHYPPNYIPYGHYISPFYVPPPAIHQFLSNGAFPQQPQAGSVYPSPQAAAAGAKFSLPQYKPGTNTGNSTHIGMPSGYGPYGSSPTGYTPNSAATAGNSNANEDLGGSQFKDSNVYISGQQSEGSAVWIAAPGRDMSSLPASSFYNLPQGQHVTFTPTQAGHGTYAGIYHPAQAVTAATVHPLLQQSQTMAGAVEMGGPAANVYQQPQHAQINWPSNY